MEPNTFGYRVVLGGLENITYGKLVKVEFFKVEIVLFMYTLKLTNFISYWCCIDYLCIL